MSVLSNQSRLGLCHKCFCTVIYSSLSQCFMSKEIKDRDNTQITTSRFQTQVPRVIKMKNKLQG